MKNEELLYKCNPVGYKQKFKNIYIKNGKINIEINDKMLSNKVIRNISSYLNYINNRYRSVNFPVLFIFKQIELLDKLSFVLLECIIKTYITSHHKNIEIYFNAKSSILTDGITQSPLRFLCLTSNHENTNERTAMFLSKFNSDLSYQHFRRLLKNEYFSKTDKLSKLYDELTYFQIPFGINQDCRDEITEVIIELIGNAVEHSESDCLLDFDIVQDYINSNNEKVYGINIAILNFSNYLLGDKLKEKYNSIIQNEDVSENFSQISKAYSNHKKLFDIEYTEEDFFNITAFQNKVSSRYNNHTGGTGLTKLIKAIEDKSENHACYVLTGKRIISFDNKYLEYNGDWIGFNDNNDFFNKRPHPSILAKGSFFMPGTAYNLSFIMKVDEPNNEQNLF